uniref:Uncharacterized protein n=1 Tax=Oryza glumipatula TaxID=40148 RepID=A0A0D9ZLQ6_9ORYZ
MGLESGPGLCVKTGRMGLLTQLMGLAFARPRCRIWQQAYLHSLDGPQQRFISTSKPQRPADLINREQAGGVGVTGEQQKPTRR